MSIIKRLFRKVSPSTINEAPVLEGLQKILARNHPVDHKVNAYSKILVYTFEPLGLYAWRESIIARALQLRGGKVSIFQCDIPLAANDMDNQVAGSFFADNLEKSIAFYSDCGFDVLLLSEYLTNEIKADLKYKAEHLPLENLKSLEYRDINVGLYALNSTVRHFLMPQPEFENELFVAKFREYVYSCLLITEGTYQLLLKSRPDKVFTSHGIYISWSPVFYLCRKLNIPVDVYGGSYRANTLRVYRNEPAAPFPLALWPKYKDVHLGVKENEILDKYIPGRKDNRNDSIKLFSDERSSSDVFDFIRNEKAKGHVVFCLFTNIAWDGFMFKEKTVFRDMFEWITKNIQYFSNHGSYSLIIKAHPAENARETNTPEKYRVSSIIPEQLPSNIYFCKPDENVKPFDLYPMIDVGLIHISTVAIEMALEDIPVLTSGANGHYSNKGFTIDPQTEDEYFEYVEKLGKRELSFTPDKEAARRYMYFRFFKEAIPFEPLSLNGWAVKSLNINSCSDLLPGKFKGLDTICEGILNDGEYSYDWTIHE